MSVQMYAHDSLPVSCPYLKGNLQRSALRLRTELHHPGMLMLCGEKPRMQNCPLHQEKRPK